MPSPLSHISLSLSLSLLILTLTLTIFASPTPSSPVPLTLRLAVQNSHASGISIPKLEQLQTQLSTKHGSPIRLVVEEQPSDPAAYYSLIKNSYLDSPYFDIYEISSTWASEFAPNLVDLTAAKQNRAQKALVADLCATETDLQCDYSATVLKTFQVGEAGKVMAAPWYLDMGVLYYRKDLVDMLVLNGKIRPPPYSTYGELEEAATVVMNEEKILEGVPGVYGFLFEAAPSDSAFLVNYEWISANGGGSIVNQDGVVTVNNEQALDALFNATQWIRSGLSPLSVLGSNAEQVTNMFKACRGPFMRNWMSEFPQVSGSQIRCVGVNGTMAITKLPGAGVVKSWGFAIAKTCANKEVAADVIAFLTSESEQTQRAEESGFLPTRKSVLKAMCNDTNPWFGCFAYSAPMIEPPSDQTGPAYVSVSTSFSTWMSQQCGIPMLELEADQAKEQMRKNLKTEATDLESIMNLAQPGSTCGLSNGVEISCRVGLSCLNGYCLNVTSVVVGLLVPVVVIILALLGVIALMRWRRKREDIAWSSYAITWSELEMDEKPLGRGTFGVVYRGRYRNTEVAIKKLLYQDENVEKEFRSETQILVSLRHPNIILFMGACFEKNRLAMVTEFMPNGTLHGVLHDQKIHIDWSQRITMLKDICSGMAFLHGADPPIYHRDLKSPNILVDADFRLKVADFGLSGVKDSDKHADNSVESGLSVDPVSFRGTLYWTAPEVMRDLPYTDKADVYSFGIMCWEILTREKLYPDMHPLSVGYKVMMEGLRPEIPDECPVEYSNIMESCWDEEVDVRPTFEDLITTIEKINVPYLTKFVTTLKDFKSLQNNQVEAYETDPSIELDEISTEVSPPTGEVTMVITDIGKWEMLWEDPSIPMVKVMTLYSMLLRRAMRRHEGYEVNTEGRICRIVFQDPLNALEWCLQVQLELLKVDWPKELLNKPYCAVSKKGEDIIRRGLVVAMGASTGLPTITLNPVSNRPEYTGPMVIKTASICKLAQYGQVLVGESTMKLVKPNLGDLADVRPKVTEVGDFSFSGFVGTEKISQVLPASLAQRNFGAAEPPSKPHLVRGVSDFQRSRFTDRRDTDPNIRLPPKPSALRTLTSSDSLVAQSNGSPIREQQESPLSSESDASIEMQAPGSKIRVQSMPSSPIVGTRAKSSDSLGKMLMRKKSRGAADVLEEDSSLLPKSNEKRRTWSSWSGPSAGSGEE